MAGELQPFQDAQGRYGFRDSDGAVQVSPRYSTAYPFDNGYAKVHAYDDQHRLLTALVDAQGREVIPLGRSDIFPVRAVSGGALPGIFEVDGGFLQVDQQRWPMPSAAARGERYCRQPDADALLCRPDRHELLLQRMQYDFCQVIDPRHVTCAEGRQLYVDGEERLPPPGGRFKEVDAEHGYAIVETADYQTLVYTPEGRRLTPDAPPWAFYIKHHYSPAAERFVSVHVGRPLSLGRYAEIFDRNSQRIATIELPMGSFNAWGFEPDGYLKHRDRDYQWHYVRLRDGVEVEQPD